MHSLIYLVTATLSFLLSALQFLMLARAILSWFPVSEDTVIVNFLYAVTEPVIMPVRALLERLGWFEGLPIDMSFFFTFMLLSILQMFL